MKKLVAGLASIVILAIGFASFSSPESETTADETPPVLVEPITGTDLKRLTLSASAAERLDVQTDVVRVTQSGELVVPSAALIITPDGRFWVYASPEPLTFERRELTQVTEEDFEAQFTAGPSEGTIVAVLGVPELYGAEFGIGK
jgi:hypothetical protein